MDLGAYAQIEELETIAKNNGIEVPRLRGYRLMSDETPVDYADILKDAEVEIVNDLVSSIPFWNPNSGLSSYSRRIERLEKYYISKDKIRWDRIHGWKRRVLKFELKKVRKKYANQYETFNKYAGRKDILYIHARIGGWNWYTYHGDVDTKPWFIEKVDDAFDSTYCDIYAKIDV